ncbi:MAG: extensin family protein [Polyangiaceae bacterium]|nr:extensin family protein [Polyangiaceae bacterium]
MKGNLAPAWSGRALGVAALALLALSPPGLASADEPAEVAYALDGIARSVPTGGPFRCPKVDLVTYKGEVVKLSAPAMVFPGFRDRLKELEKVARDVGVEVYGRAPSRIVHLGAYSCRRIAAYPDFLSEHGLGNGIDISGFDFAPLPKGGSLPEGLPKAFKTAFEVRLLPHWKARSGHAAIHARFLKTLARKLVARKDIFRVLLGPGYPGHDNHFHFDVAPYRLVELYDDGQPLVPAPAAGGAQGEP